MRARARLRDGTARARRGGGADRRRAVGARRRSGSRAPRSCAASTPSPSPPAASQPLVTGVIDVLAREADGGLLVVDYKSDRLDASERLAAAVERDYGLQRLIYALAVAARRRRSGGGRALVPRAPRRARRGALSGRRPARARRAAGGAPRSGRASAATRSASTPTAASASPARGARACAPGTSSATMREHPGEAPADGVPEPRSRLAGPGLDRPAGSAFSGSRRCYASGSASGARPPAHARRRLPRPTGSRGRTAPEHSHELRTPRSRQRP